MITFVTGIDTGIGKTIAVGRMARQMVDQGLSVITQKLVQTGSEVPAEDIVTHRNMMGIELTNEDKSGLTCQYVFPKPASPHLAARLAGTSIDPERFTEATKELSENYDNIIIEGAGGLHVPLNESMTMLDYLADMAYPTVLVTSSRLGSINHTLMSIELLLSKDIPLTRLIYNRFEEEDEEIGNDSLHVFERFLEEHDCPAEIEKMA